MRKRPTELILLCLLLVGVVLSFPIQIWWQIDEVPLSFLASWQAYTPLNLLVMAAAVVHAIMIYQASRGLLVSGLFFAFLVGWNNWVVAEVELGATPLMAWAAVIGVLAIHGVLFRFAVRRLLLQPQLRWWKTAPRTRVAIQAVLYPVLGGELQSRTFDLSMGGAFVSCGAKTRVERAQDPTFRNMEIGNHCSVRLKLDALNILNCAAQVVRKAKDAGQYPEGYGLKFVNLTSGQRRLLKGFLAASAAL